MTETPTKSKELIVSTISDLKQLILNSKSFFRLSYFSAREETKQKPLIYHNISCLANGTFKYEYHHHDQTKPKCQDRFLYKRHAISGKECSANAGGVPGEGSTCLRCRLMMIEPLSVHLVIFRCASPSTSFACAPFFSLTQMSISSNR